MSLIKSWKLFTCKIFKTLFLPKLEHLFNIIQDSVLSKEFSQQVTRPGDGYLYHKSETSVSSCVGYIVNIFRRGLTLKTAILL